jgi:transposase
VRLLLPPQKPVTGRPASDHRLIVEAMLWVARTASSWRELPERFRPWSTVASRYQRWLKEGLWTRILQVLLPEQVLLPVLRLSLLSGTVVLSAIKQHFGFSRQLLVSLSPGTD